MASPLDNTYLFYTDKIRAAAAKYGVPASIGIWQLWQESRYNPSAVSHAGATGIAQFMPGTASDYGVDPYDVDSSIDGWGRYMQKEFKRFGRWDLALAAYNAGPGNVLKYDGVPPFKETQDYVRIIMGNAGISNTAQTDNKVNIVPLVAKLGVAIFALIKFSK